MNGCWAGRPGTGLARRPVPGAKGGRAAGTAGNSVVGCDMAGEARQWQHAGNNVGKIGRCWTCCVEGDSCDRGSVNALTCRTLHEECLVDVGRVHDFLCDLHPAEVVRSHKQMWLFWCACHSEPADKRIARRGSTRALGHARTRNEPLAWPGCREPAQRPAHGAT